MCGGDGLAHINGPMIETGISNRQAESNDTFQTRAKSSAATPKGVPLKPVRVEPNSGIPLETRLALTGAPKSNNIEDRRQWGPLDQQFYKYRTYYGL